ncbi:hypothetical protein ABWH98_21045 [Labrenzia sp. ac12]
MQLSLVGRPRQNADEIVQFKTRISKPEAEGAPLTELAPRTIVQTFNSLKAFLT